MNPFQSKLRQAGTTLGNWWRTAQWPFDMLERSPLVLAFGVALLVRCWVYRMLLAWTIFNGHAQPASLQPGAVSVWGFVRAWGSDWLLVVTLVLGLIALKSWVALRRPKLLEVTAVRWLVAGILLAGLMLISLLLRAHANLLLDLETGLSAKYLRLSHAMLGWKDFFRLLGTQDRLLLLTPVVFFIIAYRGAARLRQIYRNGALGFTVVMLATQLVPLGRPLLRELADNPVVYLATDMVENSQEYFWRSREEYQHSKSLPGEEQVRSIRLVDGAFVNGPQPVATFPRAKTAQGKPWNILLFVLESAGTDYIFDMPFGEELPMPFLRRLSREGLWCPHHFATCNSSANSAFSMFTGLYPPPTHEVFSMRSDNQLPLWPGFPRRQYHTFLMHPSSISYSFPVDFLRNNGLTNLYFQEQIPVGLLPDRTDMARNEIEVMRFLERKLDTVREPFFGIYWSFIPHHPYSDYGEQYRIKSNIRPDRNRYYNNLRLLDTQIESLFRHLERSGQLDRTLVIFVGDHGEAFGQHPGIWAHSFGAAAETYRAPLLFWQPKLIAPKTITRPTSHVDIFPTVMDLLGLPWDATRIQGESLLRESRRKFIFAADTTADYITAIGTNLHKVSICLPDDEVSIYNLANDPGETAPLPEARFQTQIEALLKFRNFQTKLIEDYNTALKAGRPFPAKAKIEDRK